VAGVKVSESPFEAVEPYFELGLPLYVGSEPLIRSALARGAAGAVSGMAAAFPDVVRRVLDQPDELGDALLARVRQALEGGPFISSVKYVLGRRGVPVGPEVRRPLRRLTADEQRALEELLQEVLAEPAAPVG
jgi:4-hydroxy-tetrahydrodipicolinate synthase